MLRESILFIYSKIDLTLQFEFRSFLEILKAEELSDL